ncbi:MAG: hypothetical protein Fur0046_07930 [Cyanobacteria bacterium J069]|nr:MAG: TolC family protein [Cyanobacteria bacterium J069]
MRSLSILLSATVSITAALLVAEAARAEADVSTQAALEPPPTDVSPEDSPVDADIAAPAAMPQAAAPVSPVPPVRPALERRLNQANRQADWEELATLAGLRQNSSDENSSDENSSDERGAIAQTDPAQISQTKAVPFPQETGDDPASEPVPPAAEPDIPSAAPPSPEPTSETVPPQPVTNTFTDGFPAGLEPHPNPLRFPTRPEEVVPAEPQLITLQQAIDLARRNNRQLQAAELELERSRAQLREAQAANLPTAQVGANLNFTENNNQPEPSFFNPNPPNESDVTTSLGGTVRIDYDLFTSGQRSATIRAAEGQVRLQELEVERLSEQLRLDVSSDYYDVQQANENVRIAQDTVLQAEQSLRDALALEQAGVGTRFDVLQAQVELANAQQELVQSLSEQQTTQRQLVRRLDLSQVASVVAADAVTPAEDWTLSLEESIVLAYKNRAELEQQLVQRDIARRQRRAALSVLGPQVSVFGQYQFENANNDQDPDFNGAYQFGVQASMTLFDGGRARAQARQQELNMAIAEVNFADNRDAIRLEVEQSYYSLQANKTNIGTAQAGVEQARESLRLARLRFQAGVGTQTEVLQAQTDLTRAEVNLIQAVLGYNRSLVTLRRAISNLPDGYLAEDPLGRGDRILNTR